MLALCLKVFFMEMVNILKIVSCTSFFSQEDALHSYPSSVLNNIFMYNHYLIAILYI